MVGKLADSRRCLGFPPPRTSEWSSHNCQRFIHVAWTITCLFLSQKPLKSNRYLHGECQGERQLAE
jgi:hypothetical protein